MNLYISDFDALKRLPNDYLGVIIDDTIDIHIQGHNIVDARYGIFQYCGENEDVYYHNIANKMHQMNCNGFKDWLKRVFNDLSLYNYHDDNDKLVNYTGIVFITNNEFVENSLNKLFSHFGFPINKFNNFENFNKMKNCLF